MTELEEIARQFLAEIDKTNIEAWISNADKRIIVHTHGDLRAFVMSRFECSEISISRTSVTKARSFLTKFPGAIDLAAKTFKEIHDKLTVLDANVDLRKQELADIKLPAGVFAERETNGEYTVTMKKKMSLATFRQFTKLMGALPK